jgi:NAD+ synthase (glutamine-hydrolysing)
MPNLNIATSSLNLTPLDWAGNARSICSVIDDSRNAGVELLCFPELTISGYGCEDMFFADWVIDKAINELLKIRDYSSNITCVVGCPFIFKGLRYNCAVVISNGKIIGIVPKQNLANSGVYYESRWFTPWMGEVDSLELKGEKIPFGKLIFNLKNIKWGIEICEDAWVSSRPLSEYAKQGVSFVLNPSASHFTLGKFGQRLALAKKANSLVDDLVYVYANHQGNEAGRLIYDGGSFISRGQDLLTSTKRFSFRDYEIVSSNLEFDCKEIASSDANYCLIEISDYPVESRVALASEFYDPYLSKEEEFTQSVSLALFDYLRKSRHKAFVISLSGGADSSACAVLSYIALKLAMMERGDDYVRKVLRQEEHNGINFSEAIICAYLGTKNSSIKTYDASESLANDIGARFLSYEIDDVVKSYTDKIENTFKDLSWANDDIALQNIQARSRGPLVWLLANLSGGLLLATSNRSEAAVGYTTMDGDTCGGISPIGGINKSFLLSWLKWFSESKNHNYGEFPGLKKVLSNKPTAELRPSEMSQSDEADLMPYEILDFIEREFLIARKTEEELVSAVMLKFGRDMESSRSMVSKFLNLWTINQWKRERYAPSFHVDEESLDPKSWCRYPILSARLV